MPQSGSARGPNVPAVLLFLTMAAPMARATPSTTFWAPSTPFVQPFGVLHLTYDTYFNPKAAYPVDAGLTIGVLPGDRLQAEAGFDLLYPTYNGAGPVDVPILLNAKVGEPEGARFKGSPAWSAGIFGAGFEKDVTDLDVLYAVIGKTFSRVGIIQIGGYHALNQTLFRSATGSDQRTGLLAGWYSPAFKLRRLEKLQFAWDLQSGRNILGATGGGAYFYFTPAIDLLTGPVFFLEKDLQPARSSWMWTLQLDVDLDLLSDRKR